MLFSFYFFESHTNILHRQCKFMFLNIIFGIRPHLFFNFFKQLILQTVYLCKKKHA
ncbi:MAG: hypothetical protein ACKPKO_20790 [Candidatus Fonsibacter sp.]